jgi:hypothetical protein
MEPFFMFCAVLVVYCGYLSLMDMLRVQVPAPTPAARRMAARTGRTVRVKGSLSSGRGRAGVAAVHFPVLSRDSA